MRIENRAEIGGLIIAPDVRDYYMREDLRLPLDFDPQSEEIGTLSEQLFASLINDATTVLGWEIYQIDTKEDSGWRIQSPEITDSFVRKRIMQSILDQRVAEQQSEKGFHATFSAISKKVRKELMEPSEFPSSRDEIIEFFSHVEIQPVESIEQKEIYRFLRHSWRIPFNTTPGRTMSFIIRLGFNKKIAGIFSLASPAMWMSNRDEVLGFENLDLKKIGAQKGGRLETEAEWIERWCKIGMVDSNRKFHPNSGRFTAEEFVLGLKNSIENRILEFPLREISCNKENYAERALSLDLDVIKTTSDWITGTEPDNERQKLKRRRIVGECLDALETITQWMNGMTTTQSLSILDIFESLHGPESDPALLRAMKRGIRESKTRMVASNIAEMVICGAIPPFNSLRVGKLVAMLATSSEVKESWDQKYSTNKSVIASNLAGRPIRRIADLSAITTTGLYGRSNAQYDRIRIPTENGSIVRYKFAGLTGESGEGPSNLMLSKKSWNLIAELVSDAGHEGTTGKFGEGTSARIRRMQFALREMGIRLDQDRGWDTVSTAGVAQRIVVNRFSRSIHIAHLAHNSVRFHLNIDERPIVKSEWLGKDKILNLWRERWLIPLIDRENANENIIHPIKSIDLSKHLPPFSNPAE